jgi:hypothetical protein
MDTLGPAIEKATDAETNNIGSTETLLTGSTSSSSLARNRNPALHPTREDSPYPIDDDASSTTPFQSLAESAANAQLQLQQQINLMAQV